MLEIVPVSEFKVEALQVKYPLIDWEIHSEGSRSYWKIIRVGRITQAYQSFEDMLKDFDRKDLDALWRLVKDKFNAVMILMLSTKLQVDEDCKMDRDLVMKIFIEANKPKSKRTGVDVVQRLQGNALRDYCCWIDKGFLGLETPLFATMLVQPQADAEEEDEEDEVPAAPTSPSPTHEPLPHPHEPIPTPPQAQPAPPSSPPQEQPTTASAPDMTLLNTLMKTCTTLSNKVAALKQDKVAQALEIFKLKRREDASKKGEGIIKAIDADEDITLVDIETEVDLDTELQGRIERKDDDNAAAKEVNAAKPTVFDDEE
nr:leucine-rich repeat protein [Tanacetum cinerariifolium]